MEWITGRYEKDKQMEENQEEIEGIEWGNKTTVDWPRYG